MSKTRILVVEDEPAIAELINLFLKRCGYEPAGVAATGEEGLVLIEESRPNLVLMDINLAGEVDGIQAAATARTRFDLPVVFLTGMADDETVQRSQAAGAFGYLLKPFTQDGLKATLDLALTKHRTESGLQTVERWFSASIRSIAEAVITTDSSGRVTFLNPAAEEATGWPLERARGRLLEAVFQMVDEGCTPASRTDSGKGRAELQMQALFRRGDGQVVPMECGLSPIRDDDGRVIGQVIIFRDVSERQRAAEELRESREELRLLASHLQQAREIERTSVAREIHDQLGQSLTGLRMDLTWLQRRMDAAVSEDHRVSFAGKVAGMVDLVDGMVKDVRRISAELRPEILDDLGLIPAIEWMAGEWQQRTGVRCDWSSEVEELDLSPDQRTALFRICQEALTNVARHAGATRVIARLARCPDGVFLEIQDDGRGITPEALVQNVSFGLLGMRERAAMLEGRLTIERRDEGGTRVSVVLPTIGSGLASATRPLGATY